MLYIEAKIDSSFLRKILNVSAELGCNQFVFWFYPETNDSSKARIASLFSAYSQGDRLVQPVTLYYEQDHGEPVEREPSIYALEESSIELLAAHLQVVEEVSDSVATYDAKSNLWLGCSIFHERMSIIRNISGATEILHKHSIPFSEVAPEWW